MIKRGSKVRVVKMDTAGGMDWQAKRLEGKVFTVRFIDSAGQIHLEETGLATLKGRDDKYRGILDTFLIATNHILHSCQFLFTDGNIVFRRLLVCP